ncbi:hypothetical protein CLOBOL_00362 [Enterocloster bolteae ATCC BAA-613]|uniref:Uncharacterized protein n=1 Tax=Enterocloster bolteae (strain ATCC BAA-613 / DSM 15670 / CCUG 46953 / JCM 12243 / WAL 16351) TaxID=411902 RepID=A8RHA6_ENTBW|nr:hypothetical protein CLOBOL_00362 [Enterocloster bolteae ATCC BAA-613]
MRLKGCFWGGIWIKQENQEGPVNNFGANKIVTARILYAIIHIS